MSVVAVQKGERCPAVDGSEAPAIGRLRSWEGKRTRGKAEGERVREERWRGKTESSYYDWGSNSA